MLWLWGRAGADWLRQGVKMAARGLKLTLRLTKCVWEADWSVIFDTN